VLLDTVLAASGLTPCFSATIAGDEVTEGKPDPLIYREACRRLDADPRYCVAIEDSEAGIASGLAAGTKVVAGPRPGVQPSAEILARATVVLSDLTQLDADRVAAIMS
jgi:beta-phosphoglucomutase-like phosphatase (HAD superfamily)